MCSQNAVLPRARDRKGRAGRNKEEGERGLHVPGSWGSRGTSDARVTSPTTAATKEDHIAVRGVKAGTIYCGCRTKKGLSRVGGKDERGGRRRAPHYCNGNHLTIRQKSHSLCDSGGMRRIRVASKFTVDHGHKAGKKGGGPCASVTSYGAKAKESFQTALQHRILIPIPHTHIYTHAQSYYYHHQNPTPDSQNILCGNHAYCRAFPPRIKCVLAPPCEAAQGVYT